MFVYLNFEHVSSVKIKVHIHVQKISLIRLIFLGKINMQNLECHCNLFPEIYEHFLMIHILCTSEASCALTEEWHTKAKLYTLSYSCTKMPNELWSIFSTFSLLDALVNENRFKIHV